MTQKAKTKPQPKAAARRPQTKSAKYYHDSLDDMAWHWSSNDDIEFAPSLREGRDNGFFESSVLCENPF